MFIMNPYRFIPSVAFIGLLDTYPGGHGAYSVRLLRGAFSGNFCMRVLVSGISVEADVHFDYTPIVPVISINSAVTIVSGTSSATTLGDLISTGNTITVRTWYDQYQVIDVGQTSPSLQPQLATSGALNTINGHVTVYFDGTRYLTGAYSAGILNDFSMFAVLQGSNITGRSHSGFYESSTRFTRSISQNGGNLLTAKLFGSTLNALFNATAALEYATYSRQEVVGGTTNGYVHATVTTATSVSANATGTATLAIPAITPIEFVIGAHRGSTYSGITGYISELFYYIGTVSSAMTIATRNAILLNQIQYF